MAAVPPADSPGEANPLSSLRLDNRFARLGDTFYTPMPPEPLPSPRLVSVSPAAARLLGVDPAALAHPQAVDILAGNRPLPGGEPLAAVYAGHQFGNWAGRLGDGRAILLGEAIGPDERRWEIQLKGAGRTPYSRMGDGRAVLRSSIREFLCSEAMDALGIPTTRALAVVGSDQPVIRETVETAAVLTRLSPSFVRFGHFEHFYYCGRHDALTTLADHVIDAFYPHLRAEPQPYAALLREVTVRTARLIAAWQAVGFCHGVMNTDNMSILGLTIDYGPFGFIDGFDAHHISNHSDDGGRYAYSRQPGIGEWNCYALGQAMLPLLGTVDDAQAALAPYRREFADELERRLRAKLGLVEPAAHDRALFDRLFAMLHEGRTDFTRFFRALAQVRSADATGDGACRALCRDVAAFDAWVALYRERLCQEARDDGERGREMLRVNPKFVLRNYLAEQAIRAADAPGHDPGEVDLLLQVLSRPFDEQPENERFSQEPPDWAGSLAVSCSS
ncbi:MAG TPA: YdiU family protein [Quisquiliibacterium sp.]|nr:YdiU family protein [Quisquiliibacterium sp.]